MTDLKMTRSVDFAEKRRILQLETLYDLALALHAERPEEELVEELLQRVCTVLDPAAGVAVTRGPYGESLAVSSVGWRGRPPSGARLLKDPLWHDLLAGGELVVRRDGVLLDRPYRELLATPLAYRGIFLGFLALLDKESRGDPESAFSSEDRRFLDSVGALGGVALDGARQLEDLATQREKLQEENKVLKGQLVEEFSQHRIIAHAPVMRQVLEILGRIAPRTVNVLLRGESGTGKELAAKLMHSLSGRAGALIAINCAAMPEALLESELFGIEGGVATGVQARRGKFALADGGTLFLDEIGDLDLGLQVKLLRALQEREVTPIGGQKAVPVDVRVIGATHRNLEQMVDSGSFREDLYYRLKGVDIELPPLRERRQDIPHLLRHFMEDFCTREKIRAPQVESEALSLLLQYEYPGNIRELKNLIEGAVSLADQTIDVDLVHSLIGGAAEQGDDPLDLASVERRHVQRVLRLAGNNKSAAAKLLGVDRRTLQRKGF